MVTIAAFIKRFTPLLKTYYEGARKDLLDRSHSLFMHTKKQNNILKYE